MNTATEIDSLKSKMRDSFTHIILNDNIGNTSTWYEEYLYDQKKFTYLRHQQFEFMATGIESDQSFLDWFCQSHDLYSFSEIEERVFQRIIIEAELSGKEFE